MKNRISANHDGTTKKYAKNITSAIFLWCVCASSQKDKKIKGSNESERLWTGKEEIGRRRKENRAIWQSGRGNGGWAGRLATEVIQCSHKMKMKKQLTQYWQFFPASSYFFCFSCKSFLRSHLLFSLRSCSPFPTARYRILCVCAWKKAEQSIAKT